MYDHYDSHGADAPVFSDSSCAVDTTYRRILGHNVMMFFSRRFLLPVHPDLPPVQRYPLQTSLCPMRTQGRDAPQQKSPVYS